ncbi:DUF3108 domain-containing protein [Craterilacuibacter sp.]|uniref:DUF3108 domain-containing protein n=1 Tax=Craterilacuibacter sp. TaxID=2870909 RepID=UPI003F316280
MRALRPLLFALALSLLAHVLLLAGEAWQLPLNAPQEQALRPMTARLKKLQLGESGAAQTQAASAKTTATLVRSTPKVAPAPKSGQAEAPPQAKAQASAVQQLPSSAPAAETRLAITPQIMPKPRLADTMAALTELAASAPVVQLAEASAASAQTASPETPSGYLQPAEAISRFPDQATLLYHAYYGAAMVGGGEISWLREGRRYRIEARIKGLFGPTLRYLSQGSIVKRGLQPDSYQAFRNDTLREHARFDHDAQRLDYGDKEEKSTPLENGAQDVLSLAFQLALNGADLGETPTQITTGKKVYRYPLKAAGESDYDTEAGKMRIALVRASKDGDVNEYWLAPDFANLPVRILRADREKSLELRAYQIDIDGSPIWKLPPRKMRKNEN